MKKYLLSFVLVLAMLVSFCFIVYGIDMQSIRIEYITDDGVLENAQFSIYRIGDVYENTIIPNGIFDRYSVSFDISDAEKLNTLAVTLSAYILRDNIVADKTDVTDNYGTVDFDGEKFAHGAYLYMAQKHLQYENIYFCEPVIVILPYGDADNIIVKAKYESVPENTESVSVSYKVLKAWDDDGSNFRPVEIEAQLLRDGEIYDSVILNDDNNWRYQWDNLSSLYHWTVTEKTVENGYIVSLSENERAFVLLNSIEENTKYEDNTVSATETVPTTTPDDSELTQTGMLMWPVPYIACIGVLLLIVGYVFYRKSENANE